MKGSADCKKMTLPPMARWAAAGGGGARSAVRCRERHCARLWGEWAGLDEGRAVILRQLSFPVAIGILYSY
jgi:hypothetical protein